jgi:site-specific DNA-cytosine methylase
VRFGSLFSGIEAASVAWPDWKCQWVSEIDPFACALLKHHYPNRTKALGLLYKQLKKDSAMSLWAWDYLS